MQFTGSQDAHVHLKMLEKKFLRSRCVVSRQLLQLPHLGPAVVILQAVDGQGDHLDVPFAELAAQPGSSTQLRGAHRGVVSGVGEQDSPSGMKRG